MFSGESQRKRVRGGNGRQFDQKQEQPVNTPGFRELSIRCSFEELQFWNYNCSDFSDDSDEGISDDEPTEEKMINWHMELEKREREKYLLILKMGNTKKIRKSKIEFKIFSPKYSSKFTNVMKTNPKSRNTKSQLLERATFPRRRVNRALKIITP